MIISFIYWGLALIGGLLLALMIDYNSQLAKYSNPLFASWIAHGVGAVVALFFVTICAKQFRPMKQNKPKAEKESSMWNYLGGIPGALTVVFASITVNSAIGLSGTLALMLLGQVFFGIISDAFGLLSIPKRKIVITDFFVVLLVCTGSGIIIFFG